MSATNSGDRLTISEQAYCRHIEGDQPSVYTFRYNTSLKGSDQPYNRRYKIGTVWEVIDSGWIDSAKYLWIENHGAPKAQVQPTEEEEIQRANRIVEVTCGEEPDWLVYPGEVIRVSPFNLNSIKIRVRDEPTFVTVTLINE